MTRASLALVLSCAGFLHKNRRIRPLAEMKNQPGMKMAKSVTSSIKSWPEKERPRERMLLEGPSVLSDTELLAVVLRNGVKGLDVLKLSREILQNFQGFRRLSSASLGELKKIKGLGPAKISTLMAVGEIAKRQLKESILNKDVIREPESVVNYLRHTLQDQKIEIFKVLFLNKANAVIRDCDMSSGTVDEAHVHPREIVKKALEYYASSLVLVHNHPSGRCEPSAEDLHITRKIQTACESVSIRILDHIIIAGDSYFSFREHGRIL